MSPSAAIRRLLICRCASANALPPETRRRVLEAVPGLAGEVWVTADLCGRAAARDPRLRAWAEAGDLTVVACRVRAVRALFHAAGAPLDPARARLLDMRRLSAAEILRELPQSETGPQLLQPNEDPADAWPPWFPVIDDARCRNCRQCKNFCLFGVYGDGPDGRVAVNQPRQCKNLCPACARICPEAAIMFPKVGESPIDGDEIADEAAQQARIKVDVQRILGSDVYAALAARQKRARGRLLATEDQARAEAERARHTGAGPQT